MDEKLLRAATSVDWQQVVRNGGSPCFHLETERGGSRFCLRAKRWEGHQAGEWPCHQFVSLADLLTQCDAGAEP